MKRNLFIKIGLIFLASGLGVAFILSTIAALAFPNSYLDNVVFGLIFGLSSMFGLASFREAYRQHKSIRLKQEKTLQTLAGLNKGTVTVTQASITLGMTRDKAEKILTELVKQPEKKITLDLNADGELIYIFENVKPFLRVSKLSPSELAANQEMLEMLEADQDQKPVSEEIRKLWR